MSSFKYTPAIRKLRKLKARIRKVPGGTSGGKTYGILPILINDAIKNPGLEISVVSHSIPHLRKGALKDFLKIMKATGRYIGANYNRTLLTYTFTNGSYIEFFSADQEGKVAGPRRNILYINECNNIDWNTYHQLAIRTDQTIWLDYNPTHKFWIHTELGDDPDSEELILTYKDNTALSAVIVKEIEKALVKGFKDPDVPEDELFDPENIKNAYWANWWKVYGLGLTGSLEGVVFTNWSIIDEVPEEAILLGYGMDFGYSKDPTTWIAIYKWNGKFIYDQIIYKTGLKNSDIARTMIQESAEEVTYAESSEPKTIDEIADYGIFILPTVKGEDSIRAGIQIMQEEEFLVTARSKETITEFETYCWMKSKDGGYLPKPEDKNNHSIDGIRYFHLGDKFSDGNMSHELY